MRVLVVTTWFPSREAPRIGSFVEDDVSLLMRDHDVTVLHLAPSAQVRKPRIDTEGRLTIHRFPMDTANPFSIVRASLVVKQHMKSVDAIHTMALSSLLPTVLLRVTVPWIHTEHWSGLLAPETVPLVMRATLPLTMRLLTRPDIVAAVSGSLQRRIAAVRSRPIEVIPNHVASGKAGSRSASSELRLVAVGSAIPRKGPILAVQTVHELRTRGIDVRLTWVGDGPQREAAEREARSLGVSDTVEFRGSVPREQALELVASADVFLLPTQSETFGVAIAEALASGVPVVVGAEGGHSDFVNEPDGVLVHERTAFAYADAVQRVCQLNETRGSGDIGSAARERFSDESRRTLYRAAYGVAEGTRLNNTPVVDVVIPVHNVDRPIERAVLSVLANETPLRVTVVCHNIEAAAIAAQLKAAANDRRVRLIEHHDGIPSPTGPFNAGLERAEADFLSIMGSDDELEDGAIDSWVRNAARTGADVVIPRMRHAAGANIPTPPVRPIRKRRLSMVRDRLSYRSAPLGLISRAGFGHLRFDASVPTGEDVSYVVELWSSARRIVFDRDGPAYLVHDDAEDRTSFVQRPIKGDLEFIDSLLKTPQFVRLSPRERSSVLTKVLRVNVIGAIARRREEEWTQKDRNDLAKIVNRVRTAAPRAEIPLPMTDRDILDLAVDPATPTTDILDLARAHYVRTNPRAVRTRSILANFHRESALRMGTATALLLIMLRVRR